MSDVEFELVYVERPPPKGKVEKEEGGKGEGAAEAGASAAIDT
jgi:hypothetical protein